MKGYGGKTLYGDSQNSDTTAPSGRELYHLQFSMEVASPETFEYTLVLFIPGASPGLFGSVWRILKNTDYALDDRGSRVRFPAGAGNFSLHHPYVQNGSGALPASYPMGTRGSFPGVKATGEWSWPLISI
jgi:hypothetical protein